MYLFVERGDRISEIDDECKFEQIHTSQRSVDRERSCSPFTRNAFCIFDAINLALARVPMIVRIRVKAVETRRAIQVVASRRALILFNLIARVALCVAGKRAENEILLA